jgi:hypothetical protein
VTFRPPDAGTAAAAAVSEFDLSEEQRKRLVVRGTNSRWERCRYGWWLDAAGRETHRDHSSKLSPPTPAGEDGGLQATLNEPYSEGHTLGNLRIAEGKRLLSKLPR